MENSASTVNLEPDCEMDVQPVSCGNGERQGQGHDLDSKGHGVEGHQGQADCQGHMRQKVKDLTKKTQDLTISEGQNDSNQLDRGQGHTERDCAASMEHSDSLKGNDEKKKEEVEEKKKTTRRRRPKQNCDGLKLLGIDPAHIFMKEEQMVLR